MIRHRTLAGFAVFVYFLASTALGALMMRTQTTIPMPPRDEKTALSKLAYKPRRFEASLTSVTLKVTSEPGVEPVRAQWVFAGGNTDGNVHRVEVQVSLLDESGKRLGWFTAKHPLAAGASDQTFVVPMKVKADTLAAAKTLHIRADWVN